VRCGLIFDIGQGGVLKRNVPFSEKSARFLKKNVTENEPWGPAPSRGLCENNGKGQRKSTAKGPKKVPVFQKKTSAPAKKMRKTDQKKAKTPSVLKEIPMHFRALFRMDFGADCFHFKHPFGYVFRAGSGALLLTNFGTKAHPISMRFRTAF